MRAEASATERPTRILLAEDDDEVRTALTWLLAFDGFEVRAVSTGAALLDVVSDWLLERESRLSFDLIVTDVRMPGISGLTVVEGLRDQGCDVPMVVITAFGDDEMREKADELGAVLIEKPFSPERLEEVVRDLVARSKQPPASAP